jgi:hypothetical protein
VRLRDLPKGPSYEAELVRRLKSETGQPADAQAASVEADRFTGDAARRPCGAPEQQRCPQGPADEVEPVMQLISMFRGNS